MSHIQISFRGLSTLNDFKIFLSRFWKISEWYLRLGHIHVIPEAKSRPHGTWGYVTSTWYLRLGHVHMVPDARSHPHGTWGRVTSTWYLRLGHIHVVREARSCPHSSTFLAIFYSLAFSPFEKWTKTVIYKYIGQYLLSNVRHVSAYP
jgi:hypothetical protein